MDPDKILNLARSSLPAAALQLFWDRFPDLYRLHETHGYVLPLLVHATAPLCIRSVFTASALLRVEVVDDGCCTEPTPLHPLALN
jgi:hypothetical protein